MGRLYLCLVVAVFVVVVVVVVVVDWAGVVWVDV
jgi:hypothetical protein